MADIKLVNDQLLDELTEKAKASPRLRMNYNLHDNYNDPVQSVVNAIEPGSVLPIHRHLNKTELYTILRGRFEVQYCDENGRIIKTEILDRREGNYITQVPANTWHSVESLESGTVIIEVKDGPYKPFGPEDILDKPKHR